MKQKRHKTEEIIRILREADGGRAVEEVLREHNVSAASFYRWKRKFGGMELQDARRYRELERENSELKKMLADPGNQDPLYRSGQPVAERPRRELPQLHARRVPGPRTDAEPRRSS
ncbi:MAG: transposase [Verrucomicrobiae bacterium]|nr:transposase [Verrucomicrobiae bacterium]